MPGFYLHLGLHAGGRVPLGPAHPRAVTNLVTVRMNPQPEAAAVTDPAQESPALLSERFVLLPFSRADGDLGLGRVRFILEEKVL